MNELSLFSGTGGGLLGAKLLGWRCVGYVEKDDYCQKIIAQRIADGILDNAPIFNDIKTFINKGYAKAYTGMVNIVTGGDPCQRHSVASGGASTAESLAAQFIELVRIVKPDYVKRENPAKTLSNSPYPPERFDQELRALGYTVAPVEIRACCMGADHQRARLFMLGELAHSHSGEYYGWEITSPFPTKGRINVERCLPATEWLDVSNPYAYGSNDGLAYRMDRARAIGNGQVPAVVRAAWELLTQ